MRSLAACQALLSSTRLQCKHPTHSKPSTISWPVASMVHSAPGDHPLYEWTLQRGTRSCWWRRYPPARSTGREQCALHMTNSGSKHDSVGPGSRTSEGSSPGPYLLVIRNFPNQNLSNPSGGVYVIGNVALPQNRDVRSHPAHKTNSTQL